MSDEGATAERSSKERRSVLLRVDPAVHDAIARWAADDLRSVNAQIEVILRDALRKAGRAPAHLAPLRPRGRPTRNATLHVKGGSAGSAD